MLLECEFNQLNMLEVIGTWKKRMKWNNVKCVSCLPQIELDFDRCGTSREMSFIHA